jgi:hypothetical protein
MWHLCIGGEKTNVHPRELIVLEIENDSVRINGILHVPISRSPLSNFACVIHCFHGFEMRPMECSSLTSERRRRAIRDDRNGSADGLRCSWVEWRSVLRAWFVLNGIGCNFCTALRKGVSVRLGSNFGFVIPLWILKAFRRVV